MFKKKYILFKMLNILEDWDFISKINKGVKPCFYDKSLIGMNDWFVTFRRRYKGEKGEKGVVYVENLIETTNKYYKTETDYEFLNKIKETLRNSICGLNNLVYTYKIDGQESVSQSYSNCISQIEKIILDIDFIISEGNLKNKGNFFKHIPFIVSSSKNFT
jgi:hypothetical protein